MNLHRNESSSFGKGEIGDLERKPRGTGEAKCALLADLTSVITQGKAFTTKITRPGKTLEADVSPLLSLVFTGLKLGMKARQKTN